MKTVNSLVAALALCVAVPASAAFWVRVADFADQTESVDMSSIRYKGSKVRVWQRSQYSELQNGVANRGTVTLTVFDCDNKTYISLQSLGYADFKGDGVVYSSTIPDENGWAKGVEPNSLRAAVMNFVCKKR